MLSRSVLAAFSVFAFTQALHFGQKLLRQHPPAEELPDIGCYGIGFDFTSTFATAAISYPNGSNIGFVKAQGNEEYQQMFHTLSLSTSRHLAPPYNNLGDWFKDQPRQKWRKFLRRLGLPASAEARIIGEMVKELQQTVEKRLGFPITHAAASFPQLVALYSEDVWDAFEWAGIMYQQIMPFSRITPDVAAMYAAHGFGFCPHYMNATLCREEQTEINIGMEYEPAVLNLILNSDSLMMVWPIINSPYSISQFDGTIVQDFSLGLRTSTSAADYWGLVRDRIAMMFEVNEWQWGYWPPTKIFQYGEGASNEEFSRVVREVCNRKGNRPEYFVHDEEFMLATGTAELAKRDLYLYPGKPHPSNH